MNYRLLLCLLLAVCASGCKYYKQDIIFRFDDPRDQAYIKSEVASVEQTYKVRINDLIEFQVYTNGGELLVDPNAELAHQLSSSGAGATGASSGSSGLSISGSGSRPRYLVENSGNAILPMLGSTHLEGLTMRAVDSTLGRLFATYYKDCFVVSRIANKRCFLFAGAGASGAGGGSVQGKIVEIVNEKTTIFEVLAGATGIAAYSHIDRIRIIRGELTNPEVHIINLRNIYNLPQQDLIVRPNDIIYLEPGRRPVLDFIRDAANFTGILSTVVSLIVLVAVTRR